MTATEPLERDDYDEYAEYDDALNRIHAHSDEDARGFTNHAPMVIDALVALGRPDVIPRFLDGYLPAFPAATPGRPLDETEWSSARGLVERAPDWAATWGARLEDADDWRPALHRALAELAPGLFGGAAHGVIRVAHAVRALERVDTPARRSELARALGYWSAAYQTLPGRPGTAARADLDVAGLIDGLEVIPPERRSWGLFTEGARALDAHPAFADAVSRLRVPETIDDRAISHATTAMLGPYFESPLMRIAYVHTITAPSALRVLAPHADAATRRALFGYGVQAMAALHAISHSPGDARPGREAIRLARDETALRDRAAESLEEHVIKFTEACLREDACGPDPRWRLAAADAVLAHEATRD